MNVQELNLIDLETSEIKWKIDRFPDGQVNFKFLDFNRKSDINITTRITNSDDLFILMQLKDILDRAEISVNILRITYLLGARQDRVMDIDQPYTLKLVANVINSLEARAVLVYDPHSMKSIELINNSTVYEVFTHDDIMDNFVITRDHGWGKEDMCFVYPDRGAVLREMDMFSNTADFYNYITCGKKRDKDNNLSGFEIIDSSVLNKADNKRYNLIVKDDLCDGGGTFCGLAPLLRELKPITLNLYITHAIQLEGIKKVAAVYDYVFITDTYKDWREENLPENVKVMEIDQFAE